MKVKEESEKVGLKLKIQKIKIMALGPIPSWKIDRETMETVRYFLWGAQKPLQMVTAAMKLKDACSLEEKERKRQVKSLSRVRLFVTPMDCSPPGFSIHGIFQARILEWVAISFSRGSSQPRD